MPLKTTSQLQTERAAAGAAWLAAVDTIRAAYIELSAYDQAVASGLVNGGALTIRSFGALLDLPTHYDYLPPSWPNQADKVRARAQVVINT